MRRFSNIVIKVRRMIKVDKVGKNEQILKCCDQGEQNDQSEQGGKKLVYSQILVNVVLCCEKILVTLV